MNEKTYSIPNFQISNMKFPYKVDLIYQLESMWIYLMVL
jgi:hypothetical protein